MKKKRAMTRRQKERLMFRMIISLAVAVLILLAAAFIFGLVRKIRWNDMLLDLSYSTASVGDEDVLCAEHGEEKVRVCYQNALWLQNALQNGGMGKMQLFAPDERDRIFLDYNGGTTMTIVELEDDMAYLVYESPRMRFSSRLGYMTPFSKLETLTSAEGGSVPNQLWE